MNLIWSIEHGAWRMPDWSGYTSDPLRAGLYDQKETARILATANLRMANECAIPEELVFYAPCVDWETARCQETIGMAGETYLRCGVRAAVVVKHRGRNEGPYAMCRGCADHNIKHRGAVALRERES